MWHHWFNRNFAKLREYFMCAKKTIITQFIKLSYHLPPFWRVPRTIISTLSIVYVQHALITFWGKHTHASWHSPNWSSTWLWEKNCWINIFFSLWTVFSRLSKCKVEPLMSHGLLYRCPCHVSGPGYIYERVRELSDFIKNILICVLNDMRASN